MNIQILLSAYNGERFLRTQLNSIARQCIEKKSLLIRDDGSIDSTYDILEYFHKNYPWIHYYRGSNLGVQKSYLELIKGSDPTADYIAFSDQDDQWHSEKLARAVQCLEILKKEYPKGTPLLYCSDAQPVDENLGKLNLEISRVVRKASFGNALVQNICTGCTAVANRELMELLRTYLPDSPEKIIMHDWWLYLTASCFGAVFYDSESYILYRQHKGNTSKMKISRYELIKYRIERLFKPGGAVYRQADEFMKTFYSKLCSREFQESLDLLENFLSGENQWKKRLHLAGDRRYFRQKRFDDVIFRLILLIGKL